MEKTKRIPAVLVVTLVMLLVGGCAGDAETKSTGQYIDDAALTTKVKTALFRDDEVSGFQVDVDTFKARVQLNGFVDSEEEKQRAEQIARSTEGVQEVINNLEVK